MEWPSDVQHQIVKKTLSAFAQLPVQDTATRIGQKHHKVSETQQTALWYRQKGRADSRAADRVAGLTQAESPRGVAELLCEGA